MEGATILEASRENGIHIPTLCYHPRLRPLGQCRICLVEVEGLDKPVTACDNMVQEGMAVTTDTPAIRRAREEILSLLLSTHPFEDCLTCEKSGACELQESAYTFQVELPKPLQLPPLPGLSKEDPYIIREEHKCILCGRCLQVCSQVAGAFVYSLVNKGLSTRVAPVQAGEETTLEQAGCIHCGQCVDLCPVGALTERTRPGSGREWEFNSAIGVCLECALGCPLERQTRQGRLIRAVSPQEGPLFQGLCKIGKFPSEEEGERLLKPLLREKGELREANYEETLRAMLVALGRIKQKYGGESLAVLGDGRCSNEESYLFQKLARIGLGSNHVDLGTTPGWVRAAAALHGAAGSYPPPSLMELSRSREAIFVIGSDPEESHPLAAMAIRRASRFCGAPVVWIGYEAAKDKGWADLVLTPGEGGLADLLKGLGAAREGRPWEHIAERCGVPAELIARAARRYNSRGYTLVTPTFYKGAGEVTVNALLNLARVGGQLERGHCNLWLLPPQANARGILESGGSPQYLPGYQPVKETSAREKIGNLWGSLPPAGDGFYGEQVFPAISKGKIKGLILIGNWEQLNAERAGLEFLAIISPVLNRNVWEADLVLPGQPVFEREGYFTNALGESNINRSPKRAELMEDWRLAAHLLKGLNPDSPSYPDLERVREELRQAGGGSLKGLGADNGARGME